MPSPTYDFSVLDKAGVTQAQFGRWAGVSRVTVNGWATRGLVPAKKRQVRVGKLLDVLSAAVANGLLPVADTAAAETERTVQAMLAAKD